MHIQLALLSSLVLSPFASAGSLRGFIGTNDVLPSISSIPPSTSVSLSRLGEAYSTHVLRDGKFLFRNVSAGSYLLGVHCREFTFAPLRVDVDEADGQVEAWQTFRGNEWDNRGERRDVPLVGLPTAPAIFCRRGR